MSTIEKEVLHFAADGYNSYPAEVVRFFIRPVFADIPPGHRVQILFPPEFMVESHTLTNRDHGQQVLLSERDDSPLLSWEWDWYAPSLASELVVSARIRSNAAAGYLVSHASLLNAEGNTVFQAGLRVKVKRMADSLQYLPEIYHRDDFTNRFLMLFESFYKPISKQIDQAYTYFDPYLTPAGFLPWLGAWFGLVFEDDLPEERKRDLLAYIAPIYAKKGTKQALITFLKMYTGGEVKVIEHIDSNFVLQNGSHLGYQIALGTQNRPNSFDVFLQVPAKMVQDSENQKFRQEQYRRRVEALINMFKPAHTYFRLEIEFV